MTPEPAQRPAGDSCVHESSFLKAELFLKHYAGRVPQRSGLPRVLEVGAKSYGGQDTYRSLFPSDRYAYTGLDVEPGTNVDLVPADGYVWTEIGNESFELCISGQTFEHNPFFWVTFAEIARVLVPGGYACIIAPGAGQVHRYPYDCWRFYPDSWASLCALTGMTLVESYFESDDTAFVVPGGAWRDSALIMRKPVLDRVAAEALNERLAGIVAPYKGRPFSMPEGGTEKGPCFADYEDEVRRRHGTGTLKEIGRRLQGRPKVRLMKVR